MDLDSLEQSISLIQRLIDSESQIKSLTEQLAAKDLTISTLETKLKAYTCNTQLKSYISNLETTVESLQREVEELKIKISDFAPKSQENQAETAPPCPSLEFQDLLKNKEICESLYGYLNEEDCFKLLVCTSFPKKMLMNKLSSLSELIKPADEIEIIENKEIRGLLKQEHYFELNLKNIEEKIVSIMKTLLVMQKTTDVLTSVSLPTEKYSTIEELVINRFTPDKTVQLLHRSATYLSSNQSKMSEWVTFMDNSLANLLFESAKLLTDSKVTDKLKKDLVEKLKVAEESLIAVENERNELEEQLETEKNLKIHLAQRVKTLDTENSKLRTDLIKIKETLQQSELEKIHTSKKLESLSSEFESHRKLMSSEIFRLRNVVKVNNTQKTEILEAFSEFSLILNSLSFDLH